ncbi:hypothetical protein P153DRAFT_387107 [Dothidotthia symphoricarpi CBS 119687]|uniref:Uncharacterized protein n=1 Tax=Dothidotthia symphoricarpi CBS 119687 TaxID=1392245 RepID=A0A6A6A864_9PLEO|nr:uncharacterized protein P153DRAFT_387107 [Dothidotthia symphoricarpi CBS 119687]KAF2128152.1 hypothetical protein P153DRAFT_387107 [Dothidotthia symphoricarpi CBS 119687]
MSSRSKSATNTKKSTNYKKNDFVVPLSTISIEHDASEIITPSNFPWKELFPDLDLSNPNLKNPFTGSLFKKGHHGSSGGKKASDFKSFKFGFCLEFVLSKEDSKTWIRCGNQFTVKSQQCTTHSKTLHKDGPNQIWELMADGREGNWGMLKNTHIQEEEKHLTKKEREKRCYEGFAAAAENGVESWTDEQAVYRHEQVIEQKRSKDARGTARSKAKGGCEESDGTKNTIASRGARRKSVEGIAALNMKLTRNPNQRGFKSQLGRIRENTDDGFW